MAGAGAEVAPVTGLISTPSASQVQGPPAGALAGAQHAAFSSPACSTSLRRVLSSPKPPTSGLVSDPFGRPQAFPGLPSPSSFPSPALSDVARNGCSRASGRSFLAGRTPTICGGILVPCVSHTCTIVHMHTRRCVPTHAHMCTCDVACSGAGPMMPAGPCFAEISHTPSSPN